ncbi:hypothetical protein ACODM8_06355 [Vibrio ostreicida]|uniref:hypothetical protein n=1 Tax=Vibrio ostreicida TaxID=526588 RepID=UPI003B5B1297
MKVARTVLRGAALGNKCRLLDRNGLATAASLLLDIYEFRTIEHSYYLHYLKYGRCSGTVNLAT